MPYAIPSSSPSSTATTPPLHHSPHASTSRLPTSPIIPFSAVQLAMDAIATPPPTQSHDAFILPRKPPSTAGSSADSSRTHSRSGSRAVSPATTPLALSAPMSGIPRRPKISSATTSPRTSQPPSALVSPSEEALGLRGLHIALSPADGNSTPTPASLAPPPPPPPAAGVQASTSSSTLDSLLPLTPTDPVMASTTPMVDEVSRSLERYAREQAEKASQSSSSSSTSRLRGRMPGIQSRHSADEPPRGRSSSGQNTPPSSAGAGPKRLFAGRRTRSAADEPIDGLPDDALVTKIPFPSTEAPAAHHPKPPVINPRVAPRQQPSLGLRRQPSSTLQLNIPPTPPQVPTDSQTWSATTTSAYSYDPERPTSSMIRKKSGEILKPSLKTRSLSTPHLPIRTQNSTKSEPATPSGAGAAAGDEADRHKNVRFAGETGQADDKLENVVLFSREQKVTAVSKAADGPEGYYPTETETEGDTSGSEYVQFRTRRNLAAQQIDEAERLSLAEHSSKVPRVAVDWSPASREGLQAEHVVLERVELPASGAEPLTLRGNVLVRNVAFQKWVAVRFTMDHWQTVSEVSGTHVNHLPPTTTGGSGWDRFSFAIKLEDFKRKLDERELLLCIRFSVEGKEWWDANDGNNYRFGFKRTKKMNRRVFESEAAAARRAAVLPTPPLPGTRGSGFGRHTGWNYPGMGTVGPSGSPVGVLGTVNKAPEPVYSAPSPPDVHEHLLLKTYCAPAPPLSPPKEKHHHAESPRKPSLNVVNGQFATLAAPSSGGGHSRRRSWGGEGMGEDGWAEGSPPNKTASIDLFTPPASNMSSPPNPIVPESPSTVTSSPSSSDSSPPRNNDVISLPEVVIDPQEQDQMVEAGAGHKSNSYNEFVAKYCFFQSADGAAPVSPAHSRSATPTGGHFMVSPPPPNPYGSAYPTLGTQTTPTGVHGIQPETTYFDFNPASVYWGHYNSTYRTSPGSGSGSGSGSTTGMGGAGTPLASF